MQESFFGFYESLRHTISFRSLILFTFLLKINRKMSTITCK